MTIKVKFFASLRERVGCGGMELSADRVRNVAEVWSAACSGQPLPVNTLAAVNMEYVDITAAVKDGDEVAFFPPVTGGGR